MGCTTQQQGTNDTNIVEEVQYSNSSSGFEADQAVIGYSFWNQPSVLSI